MQPASILSTIVRRVGIVVILSGTFALSAILTMYVLFRTGEVNVPNVVGMTQEDAQREIERAGLAAKLRRVHFDETVPAGSVTVQDPNPAYPVKSGFEVKIDISKGPNPAGSVQEPEPMGPTNAAEVPPPEKKKTRPEEKKDPTIDPKTGKPADSAAKPDKPADAADKKPVADAPKPETKVAPPKPVEEPKPPPKPKKPKPPPG